jgi:hypothetical protein
LQAFASFCKLLQAFASFERLFVACQ